MSDWQLAVDIGGTFTDVVLLDAAGATTVVEKVLTTPKEPAAGVMDGVRRALARAGITARDVRYAIHGTTLVTNALIERTGAPTALVATAGHEDALEIGRETRYDAYDLALEKPEPLVPPERRFGLAARIGADGGERVPLDPAAIEALAERLRASGVEAVAVCLLHAYRNPAHEIAVAARLRERAPALRVSLSSVVSGEIREYERTSTTVANAYVLSAVEAYLRSLAALLHADGFAGQLLLMLSSGGTCTVETACEVPIRLVESGPAGGAAAAAHHARAAGVPRVLAFDMGGTTAKICLIDDGEPQITREFEVARVWRFKRGSGLPLLVPVVEMIEIGAGGGSIAHVDRMGLPKVGPESAGSEPGPAAYGRGGERPTVTDANLVLGYLDASYFLGGTMPLDVRAAEGAIRRHVAEPLGLSLTDAAWGIHAIVTENMANAALMHAVERGKEIGDYDLYAFGGAAPMHAGALAERLGARTVVIPPGAGVRSCFGFLASPLAFEVARSRGVWLEAADLDEIAAMLDGLEAEARAPLALAGVRAPEVLVRRFAEMRYRGQGYEIEVPVPAGRPDPAWRARLIGAFEDVYRTYYRHVPSGLPMEAVTWRVRAQSPAPSLPPPRAPRAGRPAPKAERPIWLPAENCFRVVPVWDRYALPPGFATAGPAVIEEAESTTIVGPGFDAAVDAGLNLLLGRRAA
ncbi:MAG: hydantoinase/oxoprolinase family protein [Candidatus Rokubacteria bacterium]|nr:hydantoinase/oxoprolinase family protein [Candidatus Rokubacteria bacterium]